MLERIFERKLGAVYQEENSISPTSYKDTENNAKLVNYATASEAAGVLFRVNTCPLRGLKANKRALSQNEEYIYPGPRIGVKLASTWIQGM